MEWKDKRVLVTGGASFIGSHLVDALVAKDATVRVVDNLSSGKLENIRRHLEQETTEFRQADLLDPQVAREAVKDIQIVFHLAADHGGRGYVDLHQVACSTNLILDGQLFKAAYEAGVEKVVFASSGCVAADTVVETERGLETIADLFNRLSGGEQVMIATEKGSRRLTHIFALGLKPQVRLRTKHGFVLSGGTDHRVLILSEEGQLRWMPLSSLKVGSRALLKSQTATGDNRVPLWLPSSLQKSRGEPRKILRIPGTLSQEFAELLGYFLGDGSLNEPRGHVVFVDKNVETLGYIQRVVEHVFGVTGRIKNKRTRSGRGTRSLVICCTSLMEYLRFLVGNTKSRERAVPPCLFKADARCRAALLRGFFEAEGHVDTASGNIVVTTSSQTLARQMQLLLLSIGICSHVSERRRFTGYSVGNPSYDIAIVYPESYRRFIQNVGFISTQKRQLLAEALRKRGSGSLDIPALGKDLVRFSPWRGPRGTSSSHARWYSRNRAVGIPRNRMREYLADGVVGEPNVDKWRFLCDESLYIDTVVSTEKAFGEVYDLSVPGPESYVSNGFISHNCVYPNYLQMDPNKELYLTEDMVGPPYDADNMYGWAKLMAELTLKAYYKERGMKSASCRYFTVYGPRGHENHAVIAMIARAFIKEDPFVVWGDGSQIRNWTWVGDIIRGTILAAEKIDDATAVNLGTMERIKVIDAAKEILRYTGHDAKIQLRPDMPTGPLNRVADNRLAKQLLGWEPQVPFWEGLHRTIDWYFSTKDRKQVEVSLYELLTER